MMSSSTRTPASRSTEDLGGDRTPAPSEAWPDTLVQAEFIVGPRATEELLDRLSPGAAARVREAGLVVELGLSLSGTPAGIVAAREGLSNAVPGEGDVRQGVWIHPGEPVATRLLDDLLPRPRPAGLRLELTLRAVGRASAIPVLLTAIGVDASNRQAVVAWLAALDEAQDRAGSVHFDRVSGGSQ